MMSYKRGIFVLFGSTFFSKKTGKIVHDANRYKMLDVSAPSINTRPSTLKSAKASSLLFFLCICMGGIGKYLSQKPGFFV